MNISQKSYTPKYLNKPALIIAIMTLTLVIAVVIAISFGSYNINIFSHSLSPSDKKIIALIRLPRVLSAVFAGSALAVSGAVIQAVLNNNMASPSIIGVNSGAGLFAIILIAVFPKSYSLLPIASFAGAMLACLVIYFIALTTGADKVTITLVGIAIGSILSAGISTIKTIFPDCQYDSNIFTIGSLSGITYSRLFPAAYIIIITLIITLFTSRYIDAICLGDSIAKSIGININLTRFIFLILACTLAGCAVSFAGLIGFVGLIVPHIARKLVGAKHALLLPASALGGAILVTVCDTLARVIFAPYEIPVGIVLSFIGGPFFIFLIFIQRKHKRHD